jgi:hypothetical protein
VKKRGLNSYTSLKNKMLNSIYGKYFPMLEAIILVTIQPYKSRLLITKVHLIVFCEELVANVFQYRFRNAQDFIEVKHSGH